MVDIAIAILLRMAARSFSTRTRGLFNAIDEQAGEKDEKAVYDVYFVPKSPYCYSISAPERFPIYSRVYIGMKQGEAIRKLALRIN